MRTLAFIAFAIGLLCILISSLILGLSGSSGTTASSPTWALPRIATWVRNCSSLGLPPLLGGVVLCVLGLLAFPWNRRRADLRPGAAALK